MAKKKIDEFSNKPVPDGTDLFLIEAADGTYFNVTKAQLLTVFAKTLAQILAIGNKTGALNIESDNGRSLAKILDAENTLEFNDGTNLGRFKLDATKGLIKHNLKIEIESILVDLISTVQSAYVNSANSSNAYAGLKSGFQVGGGIWGKGFSPAYNAMSFLTTGSSSGNFIFGYGTETTPIPRMYYNSTYGGWAFQVPLGDIDAAGHFRMASTGNPTDKILLAEKYDGTDVFAVYNNGSVTKNGVEVATTADVTAGSTWGAITGTLSAQTDLQSALNAKAPIASPTFTGTVTTPAIILSSETASTIASFDASKNIKSLSTSTYPSLTELSYGKGVKSAIQAQIEAKQFLVRLGAVAQNIFASGNFTKVGTFTVTHNSNNIDFSAGSVSFENYIAYNTYQSGSNNFEIITRHTFTTYSASSYGIWTGFTANSGASGNKIRMYCSTTNDAASGITTLARYNGAGSITATGSGTGFSMAIGDVIEQRLIRDINPSTLQYRITAISKNMRTNATSQVQIDVSYAYPVTIELNNTFRVCFGQIGGTNKLIDWQFRNNEIEHIDYLFMGDSKTTGLYTTNYSYRFGNLLATQNSKTLAMYGGPSGRADTMLLCSSDFVKYKADKVFLWLGCNQVRGNNASNAACITDLQSIKTALENAGSQVYMICPAPENGYDFSTFKAAFIAQFPNYIDFWTPFLGSGTSLNATYTDDGVHLNNAGNALAKTIINSYL